MLLPPLDQPQVWIEVTIVSKLSLVQPPSGIPGAARPWIIISNLNPLKAGLPRHSRYRKSRGIDRLYRCHKSRPNSFPNFLSLGSRVLRLMLEQLRISETMTRRARVHPALRSSRPGIPRTIGLFQPSARAQDSVPNTLPPACLPLA